MTVSYLMGGLGNQLFQIAASIGAAEWHGNEWKVQNDFKYPKYFSIPNERYVSSYALPRYTEPYFHYYSIPDSDFQLSGYFQTEKYFAHCQKLIRKLFSAPAKIQTKIKWNYRDLLDKNTCAIHVRRGDYLKLKEHHYNLETEYYLNAMEQMKAIIPDVHFVCFSDGIEWCKENIPAHEFIQDEMIIEFHLMSYCKNFIIANSTFSWWASWLSNQQDKLIIAPPKNKWFGEKKRSLNVHDLYCDNWIVSQMEIVK